ncbi:hypothetical protein K0B03_04020 [Patescibacteria group bacterium]|nr:hypothetical protein [Patescibacteria group bacterium]
MKLYIQVRKFILDIFFPIKCIGCGKEFENLEPRESWICVKCIEKIPIMNQQVCPVCEQFSEDNKTHYRCKDKTFLAGVWVASEYSNEIISQAIHKLKFNFVKDLSFPLSEIVIKSILQVDELSEFHSLILSEFAQESGEEKIYQDEKKNEPSETILIPVPLHKRRYNWRGFNQAFLLSKCIAIKFGLKLEDGLLIRKRNTRPQTKIRSMIKRKENIKDAFSVAENNCIKNKNVIIVDDVCTTSATLDECAKVIKKAGAKNVWGLVVARR